MSRGTLGYLYQPDLKDYELGDFKGIASIKDQGTLNSISGGAKPCLFLAAAYGSLVVQVMLTLMISILVT